MKTAMMAAMAATVAFGACTIVRAQMPGLPRSALAPPAAAPDASSGLTRSKPKATRAASDGPIRVEQRIPDDALRGFLARFLPRYPGVRNLSVEVDDGVVLLRGRADQEGTLDEITDVVKRVEGVRLVLNQMGTDEEVMTAWEFAARELTMLRTYLGRKWLLILLSAGVVAASAMLARLFSARAEILLAPFVGNVLLRSVLGSVISSMLVISGFLLALGAMGLTHVVLSILGLASIAGLAVGFAFRDITENFIASVLLGVRRPFQIGDYVTVAGHSGVVKSLNTRATVLVTLEGNHVRIPNATVFKEIMVNSTASPSSRHSFDVLIPHQASLGGALEAINKALVDQPGILREPPPRALVESLEPSGALVRAYFWSPAQGVDWLQLRSDVSLKAKVGLQLAANLDATPADDDRTGSRIRFDWASASSRHDAASQAAANLKRDAMAAMSATLAPADGRTTPMEHVLEQPESRVSDEGANLIPEEPPQADEPAGGPSPVPDEVRPGKISENSGKT
jgi:small conductance mechanosensitive channel